MFHTDGHLFKNAFGTAEMRDIVTEAYVEQFILVEAVLAPAQAEVGLISVQLITGTASIEYIDLDDIEQRIEEIDLFTVAIIQTGRRRAANTESTFTEARPDKTSPI